MIQSLYVDNFKAFNNCTISFSPFTVIIGNNSTGKTSVLQALSFLKHCTSSYIAKFMDERGLTVSDLASKFSNRRTMSFALTMKLNDRDIVWKISFSVDKSKNTVSLNSEHITENGKSILVYEGKKHFRWNSDTQQEDAVMEANYDHSIIRLIDLEKDKKTYPVLVAIKQFFLDTQDLAMLSTSAMRRSSQGETSIIGLSGEKLGAFIKTLSQSEKAELSKDVKKFMSSFSDLDPKTKKHGWVHLETKESYEGKTIDVSSANISDGLLRIIAFCSLKYSDTCSLILLDEIEDGINNEHLELLVSILRRVYQKNGTQIIVTTHNTVLLDYWKTDKTDDQSSILLLGRTKTGGVIAKSLFSSSVLREKLDYMYPGEIVLNMTNEELWEALNSEGAEK